MENNKINNETFMETEAKPHQNVFVDGIFSDKRVQEMRNWIKPFKEDISLTSPVAPRMVENRTKIMATQQNIELLGIFFEAHKLHNRVNFNEYNLILETTHNEKNIFTDVYYKALSIDYSTDNDDVGIILLNMAAKNGGLENMLVDFLTKANAFPIVVRHTPTHIEPSNQEVTEHFLSKVAPNLQQPKTKKIKIKKDYPNNHYSIKE